MLAADLFHTSINSNSYGEFQEKDRERKLETGLDVRWVEKGSRKR